MPRFSGTHALQMLRARGLDTPFIFVSGTIGEEVAVAAMKAGAQDYVIKGNLKRLAPAIERELRDVAARRERRRIEARLRQLLRAVEQSANFVVITDVDGTIEYANPKMLEATGYSAAEVIGRKPSLWRSGSTADQDYAELWHTILAGQDWHGEFENRRKDGSILAVSATISPIRDDRGEITHFIGIQEDVTERRAIEAQLRRSQRLEAIGQLTGGMAHDFNNLLTVIIGNLELLLEDSRMGNLPLIRLALDAALRGSDLTRQMLAFARRQSLDARVLDLNELVSATAELLRRTLGENIEMDVRLGNDLWPAFADAAQLESAITNLAINARDAMPNGGRLILETANHRLDEHDVAALGEAVPGDFVTLAVSDTGTGIPPEILARVFEPFFTTKPPGKGTGLGLSMVYGFVKQSHGYATIDSKLGHGTTIHLYLPRASLPAPTMDVAVPEIVEAAPSEATILVVEDKAEVRDVVVKQLIALNYRVVEAGSAAAALAILRTRQRVDLLFTDVIMPGGMSGIELAHEAKKLRPGLKLLLTSGFSEASLLGRSGLDDGWNLLGKPYRKRDLARRIRDLFGHGSER
jgi:PAS domain S-box-containing protein